MKRLLQQMEKIGAGTISMKAPGLIKRLRLKKIRLSLMLITWLNKPRSERSRLAEHCNRANLMKAIPAAKSSRKEKPLPVMRKTTLLLVLAEKLSVIVRVKRRILLSLMMLVFAINHVRNGLVAAEEGEEDLAVAITAETEEGVVVAEEDVAGTKGSIAEEADEEGAADPAIHQMSRTRTPFPVLDRDDKTFWPRCTFLERFIEAAVCLFDISWNY